MEQKANWKSPRIINKQSNTALRIYILFFITPCLTHENEKQNFMTQIIKFSMLYVDVKVIELTFAQLTQSTATAF